MPKNKSENKMLKNFKQDQDIFDLCNELDNLKEFFKEKRNKNDLIQKEDIDIYQKHLKQYMDIIKELQQAPFNIQQVKSLSAIVNESYQSYSLEQSNIISNMINLNNFKDSNKTALSTQKLFTKLFKEARPIDHNYGRLGNCHCCGGGRAPYYRDLYLI